MSYANITVRLIYESISDVPIRAEKWVEAENIFAVREYVCNWFDKLENGEADDIEPDPFKPIPSQEETEHLVEELEADFMREHHRFLNLDKTAGPGFARLKPQARLAFVQGIREIKLTNKQIRIETERRLTAGEALPPTKIQQEEAQMYDDLSAAYALD